MKLLLSILTSVVFTTYLMANNSIVVNTTQDLINAVSTVKPGDTILLADGTYKNLRLSVTTDGTNDKMITIKAQNPGKAYIRLTVRESSAYMPTTARCPNVCSMILTRQIHHIFLPISTNQVTYRNIATYTTAHS